MIKIDIKPVDSVGFIIYVPVEHAADFKHMVARALMTWQQPPAAIREFADTINPPTELPKTYAGLHLPTKDTTTAKETEYCNTCEKEVEFICNNPNFCSYV